MRCNSSCSIPLDWAHKLYNSFCKIDPRLDLLELQANLIDLESCHKCSKLKTKGCNLIEFCDDTVRLLLHVSPHFQLLRTIIRRIYEIREINIWLMSIDDILDRGSLNQLENIIRCAPLKVITKIFSFSYLT